MSDPSPEPLTDLAKGNDEAIEDLWLRARDQLRKIARRHLNIARPIYDSEDIANSAFQDLIKYVRRQRDMERDPTVTDKKGMSYEDLRFGILKLAGGIAKNKAREANRNVGGGSSKAELDDQAVVDSRSFEPHLLASVHEQLQHFEEYVSQTPELQQIYHLRLLGLNAKEIAKELGVSEATVSRRTKQMRKAIEERDNELSKDA